MVHSPAGTARVPSRVLSPGTIVVTVAAAAVAGAGFLPWIASGRATYSSYALAAVARDLQVFDQGLPAALPIAWVCVPLLASLTALAALTGHRALAAAGAGVLTVLVLVAVVVLGSWAGSDAVPVLVGPRVAVAATSALVLGATLVGREARADRRAS